MPNAPGKSSTRRAAIKAGRPDSLRQWWDLRRADGTLASLWIALCFAAGAMAIMSLRSQVIPFRPGQYVSHDVVARADFVYLDHDKLADARERARTETAHIYRPAEPDPLTTIEQKLLDLPKRVAGMDEAQLPVDLRGAVQGSSLTRLREAGATDAARAAYDDRVSAMIGAIRKLGLVIVPDESRPLEVDRIIQLTQGPAIRGDSTYSPRMRDELQGRVQKAIDSAFSGALNPTVTELFFRWLTPTHAQDDEATALAARAAAEAVPHSAGQRRYAANQVVVPRGEINDKDWQLLKAESTAFADVSPTAGWLSTFGLGLLVLVVTGMLAAYIVHYQARIVRNHARAISMAAMMLAMLLVAQLSGISPQPYFIFSLAPSLLVAMIMAIVYDRRFGVGIGMLHAILVAVALREDVNFLLIVLAGVITGAMLLDEIRTRSKLIEVGGAAAVAMMLATAAAGLLRGDPEQFILKNCLHAGGAGLGTGFVVLGILPFIERIFRITTAMTLLELADVTHPLLRRISDEAPGTWNHSLQVAAMSEEAAEAIGANALMCRVGSYYHDCGKINKPEYFVENQHDGVNRHLNLSPSVSLLIIIGHVKDGIELAKLYNLPTSLFPFIQQHHGTTLVEFFYDRACRQNDPNLHEVSETQYRYPGPKPKSREIAIVMLADVCESAARAMTDPTASRIESLVAEMSRKRLDDGQFDECDLTMRELELVKRSLIKSLLGIYHGRIAYPGARSGTDQAPAAEPNEPPAAAKSA